MQNVGLLGSRERAGFVHEAATDVSGAASSKLKAARIPDPSWAPKTRLNDTDIVELVREYPQYRSPEFFREIHDLRLEIQKMKLGNCKAADTLMQFMFMLGRAPLNSDSDYNPQINGFVHKMYEGETKALKERIAIAEKIKVDDVVLSKSQLRQINSRPMKDLKIIINEILSDRVKTSLTDNSKKTLESVSVMLKYLEEVMLEREAGTHLKSLKTLHQGGPIMPNPTPRVTDLASSAS